MSDKSGMQNDNRTRWLTLFGTIMNMRIILPCKVAAHPITCVFYRKRSEKKSASLSQIWIKSAIKPLWFKQAGNLACLNALLLINAL